MTCIIDEDVWWSCPLNVGAEGAILGGQAVM